MGCRDGYRHGVGRIGSTGPRLCRSASRSQPRTVVIIGNGNVALDVARCSPPTRRLARTDIADHALRALRDSAVREVVDRRPARPAHSAFTLPELIGLTAASDVVSTPSTTSGSLTTSRPFRTTWTRSKLEIFEAPLGRLGTGGAPAHPAGLRAHAPSACWVSTVPAAWSSRSPAPTSAPARRGPGADFDRLPRPNRFAICRSTRRRRSFRMTAAGLDTRGAPESGGPVPGRLRRGLDQAWAYRVSSAPTSPVRSRPFSAVVADFNAGKLTDPPPWTRRRR